MNILSDTKLKEYCGGVILLLIGLGAAVQAQVYNIGTLHRMGPGYFPAALGIILAATGVAQLAATVLKRQQAARAAGTQHGPEWRGWFCICAGVITFAVLGEYTGLVPATFGCVFVTALGDRDNSLRDIILLAAGITVAGVLVFWWGLGILFPLFSRDFM